MPAPKGEVKAPTRVKWSKAELEKFISIVTGKHKEDVFTRLAKATNADKVEEANNERRPKLSVGGSICLGLKGAALKTR